MSCLIYVDPSPRGEWALALARLLQSALRPPLVLLATDEDVQHHPELLEQARARLGRTEAVALRHRPGPAERAIVAEAAEAHHDLIVVPPAGRKAIARMMRGSRVATVVRKVQADVLVARRPPPSIRRVLAALSGGRLTLAVAEAAARLAGPLGAELLLLHVAPEVTLPFAHHPALHAPAGAGGETDALRTVRAAADRVGAERVDAREGLVVEEVLEEVEAGAHDLLVLGASSAPAAQRWAVEDVTERVLLRCPVSTLIVREEGAAR
jgi:nucleotide-binding universal stress UspA family protein